MAGLHNEAAGGSSFHPSASSSYRAGASFQDVPGETLDGRSRSRANTLGGRGQGEDAFSERGSMSVPTASFGGLVNHAAEPPLATATASESMPGAWGGSRLTRMGTGGLANLATEGDDGTRPNALPRAQELLQELEDFEPNSEEQRQKLVQALENLRRASDSDLRSAAGQGAFRTCERHIQAVFDAAIRNKSDKDANGALWLAGRLPATDDGEDRATLQDRLRQRWDGAKMDEALQRADARLDAAAGSAAGLEVLMDELDLAEFHAQQAGRSVEEKSAQLLSRLRPRLASRVSELLGAGRLEEVEAVFAAIGAGRVGQLGLERASQELTRRKGLELLRSSLWPTPGQIGFPQLKRRQLQQAKMNVRTAVADDTSGDTMSAVRSLLLKDILPASMDHSKESADAAIRTCFDLRLSDAEVWTAAQEAYGQLPTARKTELAEALPALCRELRKDPPKWLLTPQQAAVQGAIREALRQSDSTRLQQACQQVMETAGGQTACREEMEQAVHRLRAHYKLPANWDVEAMIGDSASRLLAKNEVTDRQLLGLFNTIVQKTARPKWTRDRKGGVPQSFEAVKAVQVLNGNIWRDYIQRRDEIAAQCRRLKARHDQSHWETTLGGTIMSMDCIRPHLSALDSDTPLSAEANEAWLMHGSSHEAAEGITSEDFDMTRANPSGLFGAGVYFAESVSKSDEYVRGGMIGGREVFPLLLCRVCLGYVYYCDERRPDRRQLERNCIEKEWHSVLGDRVKTSGTFREFIIYDSLQAFPAYIIYYARKY